MSCRCQAITSPANILETNESLIKGLYLLPVKDDRLSFFRFIFSKLDSIITVYPTENYYYFRCSLSGVNIKGNIGLLAHGEDDRIVSFSYEEEYNVGSITQQPLIRELILTEDDNIYLKKISDFKYTIRFEGKTVTFNLYDIGMLPPVKATIGPAETYIGPSFDESGLQFYLIYNANRNSLFWILNEDNVVPEQFLSYTDDLLIGRSTEFAFFDDKENNRKILIGVKEDNVIRNTWYDGPFDQLPDNYIKLGAVNLKKYIEACYPEEKGKIDKFGIYISDRESRVAIAPYMIYSSKDQLVNWIDSLRSSSEYTSDFYTKLTKAK
jgi:hypothetical protein